MKERRCKLKRKHDLSSDMNKLAKEQICNQSSRPAVTSGDDGGAGEQLLPGGVSYQCPPPMTVGLEMPLVLGSRTSARTAQMKANAPPMPNAGVLSFPKALSIGPAVSAMMS